MKKNGVTLIELAVVVSIFFIMIAVLAPFVHMAKVRANEVACRDNLRQISLGLHKYAMEHRKAFPPDLNSLYPKYVDSEAYFDCPASKSRGTARNPDYDYIAGLKGSSSKEIMVQDREGNHNKAGKNILRADGSIEWIK